MKKFVNALMLVVAISPELSLGQNSQCKEGDQNCKAENPFELCKEVDPTFARKSLDRDDVSAMEYDACIAISRIQCVEAAEVFVKSYKNFLEAYTGNARKDRPTAVGLVGEFPADEINVNIFDNFRALKVRHAEIFKEIIKAQQDFSPIVNAVKTMEDAQNARNVLADRVKSIRNLLAKVSHHDRVYINLIDQSQDEIASVATSAQGVLSRVNCNVLREPVDKMSKNSNKFLSEVAALKSYVAKSTIKRSMALEKFKRGMELAIYGQYAAEIGKSLDQVMQDTGILFALDESLWEVTEWWTAATSKGLASRLHTEYLQYKKPLEILHTHLGRADQFRKKILSFNGLDSAARDEAIAIIEDKEKTIQKDIDFLVKRGWAGQLERQKIFAKKRESLIPVSNKACHEETAKYFALANEASTFEKYELTEAQYKKHYDACAIKG